MFQLERQVHRNDTQDSWMFCNFIEIEYENTENQRIQNVEKINNFLIFSLQLKNQKPNELGECKYSRIAYSNSALVDFESFESLFAEKQKFDAENENLRIAFCQKFYSRVENHLLFSISTQNCPFNSQTQNKRILTEVETENFRRKDLSRKKKNLRLTKKATRTV